MFTLSNQSTQPSEKRLIDAYKMGVPNDVSNVLKRLRENRKTCPNNAQIADIVRREIDRLYKG